MRMFLGITGGVIAIIAFIGVLYLNSQRYSLLSADLSMCVQGKMDQQGRIQDYKLDIDHLNNEIEKTSK